MVTMSNWEDLARGHTSTPVVAKLERVLAFFGKNSKHPGAEVRLDGSHDYPRFDAASGSEIGYLVNTLEQRGDLEHRPGGSYMVTAQGWEKLSPSLAAGDPGTCFVAMASDSTLNPAYDDGFKPAIVDDCGFSIVRIDRVEHNQNINDLIIAELRRCQFLVADFTLHRNGVYFEAGYALGLDREVVFTCQKDDFKDNVHFDTRPYNHILWKTPDDLRISLRNRIRATVRLPGEVT